MKHRRSDLVLVLAVNLLPLAGIAFLGWSVAEPVVIYSLEALLVGLVDIARIAINTSNFKTSGRLNAFLEKCFYIPCFIGIYIVPVLGVIAWVGFSFFHPSHDAPTFLMGDPMDFILVLENMIKTLDLSAIGIALLLLFSAELKAFRRDHLRGEEHEEQIELRVFIYPLGRLILLLLIVIPGGIALYFEKNTGWYAVLLVLARTASDLLVHTFGSRKGPKNS